MTSPYIILHALLTRILSQIKSIVCVAAFPLPKKFRVQPSFFREPFLYQYNLCCLFICSGDHMGSPLQNVAYITFGYRWWHTLGFSLIGRLNFVSGIICATRSYVRDVEVADCRWQSFCDLTESADESRPLQGFAYITFGCRGRRPRRPVRCSSNNAVMLIINSSFRVIFSYREHPLQHRRVLNPSPAELPCYNS